MRYTAKLPRYKWTDKSVAKHKHDFCVHAVCKLTCGAGFVKYYDVMKCNKCNSFHCIPKDGNIIGIIDDTGLIDDSGVDTSLPMVCLRRSHKYTIGFDGAFLEGSEQIDSFGFEFEKPKGYRK